MSHSDSGSRFGWLLTRCAWGTCEEGLVVRALTQEDTSNSRLIGMSIRTWLSSGIPRCNRRRMVKHGVHHLCWCCTQSDGSRARITGTPPTYQVKETQLQSFNAELHLESNFEVQSSMCSLHLFKHRRVDNRFLPPQLVLDSEGPSPPICSELARHSAFPTLR